MLVTAGVLVLACFGAASYLGLWQKEAPTQPSASAAGVIQLPLPEFAASESVPPDLPAPVQPESPVAIAAVPAQSRQVSASPSRRLYVQAEALNVRQGPGVDTLVIRQVNRGQELNELERRAEWVKVGIGGTDMVGWVYSTYVNPEPR